MTTTTTKNELHLGSQDWATSRGAKWRAHVAGMEATLAPIDGPLVDALLLDGPLRIADVGCGGGGTTIAIHRRAAGGSVVHGFDIVPELVEHARRRIPPEDQGVSFEVADVATARPPVPYDRLVSRFGVMFFEDPPAAFANLARWLAPGGRFAFAVWGPPSDNPWITTARDVVDRIVPVPRPAPGAPGPFRYAEVDRWLTELAMAGLDALSVHPWRGSLPVGGALTPKDAARFALASFSSFSELLADAGDEAQEEAQRSLTERFVHHHHDGAVRLDALVHVVSGARRS